MEAARAWPRIAPVMRFVDGSCASRCPCRSPDLRGVFAQPASRVQREVGQHAVGAGALEAQQRFQRALALVEPAVGEGGLEHRVLRSEEHTSELQSLMRISYAVFCLKKKNMYRQNLNQYLN